ncbi:hypothetical protein ISCGN_024229 [Ixodes scapularis]
MASSMEGTAAGQVPIQWVRDAQSPAHRLLMQMCETGDQPAIATRIPVVSTASTGECSSQNENVALPPCDTSRISSSPPRKRRPLVRYCCEHGWRLKLLDMAFVRLTGALAGADRILRVVAVSGDAQSPAHRLLMQMCETGDQPAIATRIPVVSTASTGECSSQNENVALPPCDTSRISSSPPRKRRPLVRWKTPKSNVAAFLEKRNTRERVLMERQLNHHKRRLALKEMRLALDQRKFDEEAQAGTQERHLEAE